MDTLWPDISELCLDIPASMLIEVEYRIFGSGVGVGLSNHTYFYFINTKNYVDVIVV